MKIDGARLLSRLEALSRIGRTQDGGVTRLALSPEDSQARAYVLRIAAERGLICSSDSLGNLFLRRQGGDPEALPVLTGSHLDTQRNGGNLDGILGVLAGLEVLETLCDENVVTDRPVELVIWNNEEGVRYSPVTMGSGVYGGFMEAETILRQLDREGISVADALVADAACLPPLQRVPFGAPFHGYVELHIEQGPILEAAQVPIGVVTGIQGVRQFRFIVRGRAAHAGTTPAASRSDAFVEALALHACLVAIADVNDTSVRFTVGQFEVLPGTPNTVPGEVRFYIDLRHPDADVLTAKGDAILAAAQAWTGACAVEAEPLIHSAPLAFAEEIVELVRRQAAALNLPSVDLVSGATHDARNVAHLGNTGMIFVPSRGGISHNPAEWTEPQDIVKGAELLAATIMELSRAS